VDFIDETTDSLSTVYFVYDPRFLPLKLGIYSILKACQIAQWLQKKYFYLGYYIEQNKSMSYKGQFKGCQFFDWTGMRWNNKINTIGNGM